MKTSLRLLSDRQVIALYPVAKTRMYAFFRNPHHMIMLRKRYEQAVRRQNVTSK